MSNQRISRGKVSAGSFQPMGTQESGQGIGAGQALKGIIAGTVTVDPPNILAAAVGSVAITITGIAPGDLVFLFPPNTFEAGLVLAQEIITANTVTQYIGNVTVGAINGASLVWSYVWIDLT